MNFHRPILRSKPDADLIAPERAKLTAAKEGWVDSRRLEVAEEQPSKPSNRRLPPGQTLTQDMPVLDLGHQPNIPAKEWRFAVTGRCGNPLSLDFVGLEALGPVDSFSDIHCVTGWSRFDSKWRGLPLRRLLALAAPGKSASHAIFKGYDGYRTALPLSDLTRADILLAFALDGAPLPRAHGGPVRLVVPHLYFWKSVKWLRAIHLTDRYAAGTWEARGYHDRGDPWKQERYR